jgi:hypothetical protein
MDLNNFPDLEYEMSKDAIVIAYLGNKDVAKDFYRALANMQWRKNSVVSEEDQIIDKLKGDDRNLWSCSWRYAGGIIADIRNANYDAQEDYLDYYCAGNEGEVTPLVKECFERMGWKPEPWN